MYVNSYGKWLHIPRNLYTWTSRENSESAQAGLSRKRATW